MPILRRKALFKKVWRPPGTRYAESEPIPFRYNNAVDLHQVGHAVEKAVVAFIKEFNRFPDRGSMVVEVSSSIHSCVATVYELPIAEDLTPQQQRVKDKSGATP